MEIKTKMDDGGSLVNITPIRFKIYFTLLMGDATFPRSYIGQYTRLSHGAPTIHRSRESGVRFPDAEHILSKSQQSQKLVLRFSTPGKTGS
jgi:hypothetical protein